MTVDDALLWLNDRLGKSVAVSVTVAYDDFAPSVFEAEGELRHWSEGMGGDRAAGRDDIAGLYAIGGASLDLSKVRPLDVSTWPNDPSHLRVQLDENTALELVEQQELFFGHGGSPTP